MTQKNNKTKKRKKYEYKTEHVLTIENLRWLIGMFFIGIAFLVGAYFFGSYLIDSGCCETAGDCNLPSSIGLFLLWALEVIIILIGLICIFGVFVDEGGNKIKVRKEVI